MCSGWLVAGRAWTIWLRLHTKPEWICFQLSRCAAEKEPGFTLAGRETDTQYLTDGAFPASVCILLGSLMGRYLPTKSCSRNPPLRCLPGVLSRYVLSLKIMARIPEHRHKGAHTRNWMSRNAIVKPLFWGCRKTHFMSLSAGQQMLSRFLHIHFARHAMVIHTESGMCWGRCAALLCLWTSNNGQAWIFKDCHSLMRLSRDHTVQPPWAKSDPAAETKICTLDSETLQILPKSWKKSRLASDPLGW